VARTAAARPRRHAVTPRESSTDSRQDASAWCSRFVAIYVVMLVALAIHMALYVVAALAALLVVRPFSRFALPALRGGVFNGNALAETPAAGMFIRGAVPTTALVYPLSHGLPMLAGAAVLGGFSFRPLVRALDGKPLPTSRSVKRSMRHRPSDRTSASRATSGSGSVRPPERSRRSDIPPVCNAARTSPSTSATRPRISQFSARSAPARPRASSTICSSKCPTSIALLELQVRAADDDRDASLDARRLKNAINYEATVAAQYTKKERSGVNRTIETALARFADRELEDAFYTDAGGQANL